MSDERRDVEQKLMAGSQKSADVEGENQNSVAAAAAPTDQPLPRIFQMNIDCFDELFEWLSIRDLLVLRQTCKRFKALADYYIRTFYPAIKLGRAKVQFNMYRGNIDQFYRMDPNHAKLIKQIHFVVNGLNGQQIEDLKEVLGQIEALKMRNWQIEGEFYESFLKFCPNVKHLTIQDIHGTQVMGDNIEWLFRRYPKFESVEFDDTDIGGPGNAWRIPEVKTFFESNPNIHTFSTTFHFLRENQDLFIKSNIKFELLKLNGDCFLEYDMRNICSLVNILHEQGFYSRLNVRADYIDVEEDWSQITTMPAIESLHLTCVHLSIALSPSMSSLKQLGFKFGEDYKDPEELARNLLNVERVYVEISTSTNLLPFIRYSARVKEIRVDDLGEGTYFVNSIVDVAALNKEREKLGDVCKQTIYVDEEILLATKWAGKPTKCALVEVKRAEASEIEW